MADSAYPSATCHLTNSYSTQPTSTNINTAGSTKRIVTVYEITGDIMHVHAREPTPPLEDLRLQKVPITEDIAKELLSKPLLFKDKEKDYAEFCAAYVPGKYAPGPNQVTPGPNQATPAVIIEELPAEPVVSPEPKPSSHKKRSTPGSSAPQNAKRKKIKAVPGAELELPTEEEALTELVEDGLFGPEEWVKKLIKKTESSARLILALIKLQYISKSGPPPTNPATLKDQFNHYYEMVVDAWTEADKNQGYSYMYKYFPEFYSEQVATGGS